MAGVLTARQCVPARRPGDCACRADAYVRTHRLPLDVERPSASACVWMERRESGFFDARWDHYCELMVLYLLGHRLADAPVASRHRGGHGRAPVITYGPYRYISHGRPRCSSISSRTRSWTSVISQERETRESAGSRTPSTGTKCTQGVLPGAWRRSSPGYSRMTSGGSGASDSEHGYVAWGGPPRCPASTGRSCLVRRPAR